MFDPYLEFSRALPFRMESMKTKEEAAKKR